MGREAGRAGLEGERAAERHLVSRGYRIQDRRYRAPGGELDLVAESPDGILVFVEVKARSGADQAAPLEAVHPLKQRRLAHAAAHYLQARGRHEAVCRFDVISLTSRKPLVYISLRERE
jgi:putative endonuclease